MRVKIGMCPSRAISFGRVSRAHAHTLALTHAVSTSDHPRHYRYVIKLIEVRPTYRYRLVSVEPLSAGYKWESFAAHAILGAIQLIIPRLACTRAPRSRVRHDFNGFLRESLQRVRVFLAFAYALLQTHSTNKFFYNRTMLLKKIEFLRRYFFLSRSPRSLIATGGTFPRYPMKLVTRRAIDVSVV